MRVLLTGATGFLGAHLVRELAAAHEVVAFARHSSRTQSLEARGVEVRRGAFDDAASLRAALEGVEAVVHAAGGGIVKATRDFYRNNEDSVRAIVGAADEIERFVFISSLAAHGPGALGSPASEEEPDRPVSHYGKSKRAGERAALEHADRFGVTILRPPALYGPGEHRMVGLFKAAERGVVPMVHPDGTLSMLSGADCARAVVRSLEVQHASGVYFLSERRVYGRREMATLVGRAVGKQNVRVLPVAPAVMRGLGGLMELGGKLLDRPVMLSRDKARDATQPHQTCDPSLAMRTFDWSTEDDFERGAREAYLGYRERGWL